MAEQLLDLIIKRLDRIEEKQDRTLEQTTKTNGRVTAWNMTMHTFIDEQISALNSVRFEMKGRDKVIWIVMGSVGVIIVQLINHFLNK